MGFQIEYFIRARLEMLLTFQQFHVFLLETDRSLINSKIRQLVASIRPTYLMSSFWDVIAVQDPLAGFSDFAN